MSSWWVKDDTRDPREGEDGGGKKERFDTKRGGEGVLIIMHGRSRMTIDPRIPTIPARNTLGFHRPGRYR